MSVGPCSPIVGVRQVRLVSAIAVSAAHPFLCASGLWKQLFDWFISCYPIDGTDVLEFLAPDD